MIVKNIDTFLKHKGIKISQSEKELGLSNSTLAKAISGNKSIKTDNLEKFLNLYKEINPTWLLTGEGEMLATNQSESIGHSEENDDPKYLRLEIKGLKVQLKGNEKLIASQEKTISTKQQLIDKLNDQIKSLGGDAQESA